MLTTSRPTPPAELLDTFRDVFVPAPDLLAWIAATFIQEGAALENPDHAHLQAATLGALWTSAANARHGRTVIGQAELMPPTAMGKWQRARAEQQIAEWFGEMPDFLLTFSAPAAAEMDDAAFCALVEHELYHCGQERDAFGAPKFTRDGKPKFGIRGHDVEQFVGVVERYGADAADVRALVEAANRRPTIARGEIAGACGTCLRVAA